MLVKDTLRSPTQYLTAVRWEETAEHRAKTFHGLVLCGKLLTAARWIMEREKGGVLLPEEHCTKMGEHVLEVLCTNHPDARPPSADCWTLTRTNRQRWSLSTSRTMWCRRWQGASREERGQGGLTWSVSNTGSSGLGRRVVS